jgi:predicted nucleic acid-binding protein
LIREAVDRFIAHREEGDRNTLLRGRFGSSHGTGLADALIAATANQHDSILVTLNRKRYPVVSKCEVPYAKAR